MAPDFETVVIGAGVVGLACAYEISQSGRETLVIDAATSIGQGISSRNSEVIHAGIYYPTGSHKAKFCVEGREALYSFCETFGVPHRKCGKIIVATSDEQLSGVRAIQSKAVSNGVGDLRYLDRSDLRALEPELEGLGGLLSPSTGIIDSHTYMLTMQGVIEEHGGTIALRSGFVSARSEGGLTVITTGGPDGIQLTTREVVIAGGLFSSEIASQFNAIDAGTIPKTYFARGNYFSLSRRAPFQRLIYPIPEPGGLGVHLTLDMAGQARFGPDVEWLPTTSPNDLSYDVDPNRAATFYSSIRRYWPDLKDGELAPAYNGVRPKLVPYGHPDADFAIHGPRDHGAYGIVALYGIESPGLTSSLAIAKEVERILRSGRTLAH